MQTLAFSAQYQVSWIADLSAGQAAEIIIALLIDVRTAGAYEEWSSLNRAARDERQDERAERNPVNDEHDRRVPREVAQ